MRRRSNCGPSTWTNPNFAGIVVSAQSDGSFAVAWSENWQSANSQAYVRYYDANLNPSAITAVGPQGDGYYLPGVALDAKGDYGVMASDGVNTWGQFFNANDNNQPESDAFQLAQALRIRAPSTGDQSRWQPTRQAISKPPGSRSTTMPLKSNAYNSIKRPPRR